MGYEVLEATEYLLIFGGIDLANVTTGTGRLLFNDCSENAKAYVLDQGIDRAFTANCGAIVANELWKYNIKANEWSYIKPTYNKLVDSVYEIPYPRYAHTSVYTEIIERDVLTKQNTTRKYMYMYGGFAVECGDACDELWRFEIPWASQRYYPQPDDIYWNRGGHWEHLKSPQTPGPRAKHSMVVSPTYDSIYLFGGMSNNTFYDSLWHYRVSNDIWEELPSFGISKVTRDISLWDGSSITLDVDIKERKISDDVVYSSDGAKPAARVSASFVYWTGTSEYLLLYGGLGVLTGQITMFLADFWVFSLSTSKWTEVISLNDGPSARAETNMLQLDSNLLLLYGGRNGDTVYGDTWLYSMQSNSWHEWTKLNFNNSDYPPARTRAILAKSSDSLILHGGFYSATTNLVISDIANESFEDYVNECQDVLAENEFDIKNIGDPEYADIQSTLYSSTGNECFLRDEPPPEFTKDLSFPQGIWVLNLTTCIENCSGGGKCVQSLCICHSGYYGDYCQFTACPGMFCIYDSDFLVEAACYECSGHGECTEGVCVCEDDYIEDNCRTRNCTERCLVEGTCVEMFPQSQCDCPDNVGGDECTVLFCLNNCNFPNGVCNEGIGKCTCEGGYYGDDCSVKMITA